MVNESKPSLCRRMERSCYGAELDEPTLSAPMMCSGAIVFFDSCSHISFASDDIK